MWSAVHLNPGFRSPVTFTPTISTYIVLFTEHEQNTQLLYEKHTNPLHVKNPVQLNVITRDMKKMLRTYYTQLYIKIRQKFIKTNKSMVEKLHLIRNFTKRCTMEIRITHIKKLF